MLLIGAAARKCSKAKIKLNKSKIKQKKVLWSSYSKEKKHKILTTSTCNLTVALQKQTIP